MTSPASRLRLCLIDMNNGHANQAMRCFAVMIEAFFERVTAQNPELECELVTVEPRNKHELPPAGCDLFLSSGGPGGPADHDGEPWLVEYRRLLDSIVEAHLRGLAQRPSMFGVCYTFELLIRHFEVAEMRLRDTRKFGVMPVYMTDAGMEHPLTERFRDRLFAFEHRNWEAVGLDERKLAALGGRVLARESRDGISKGRALLGLDFAPGIEGTQFHPEADKPGVVAWLAKREQAEAFVAAYGKVTYEKMLQTLDNPERIAKTFTLLIPGWLTRKFNGMAAHRGWVPLPDPVIDLELFAGDAPPASSVAHPSLIPPPVAVAAPAIPRDRAPICFDESSGKIDESFLRPIGGELDPAALEGV